jgi:hypothetical protein
VSNIKKTPLEHALDLIQAQKAWIMAVPDHTPLPAMPGFNREEADQLEAVLAEQVAFEKSLNTLPEHDALIKAITMCPHTIDAERVTLEWSGASPGGNTALNQLTTRIHEWKKQFSGPSFIDLRDMPDDQKHALMQSIKAKPAMPLISALSVVTPDVKTETQAAHQPVQLTDAQIMDIRATIQQIKDCERKHNFSVFTELIQALEMRIGIKTAQPAVPLTELQRKAIYDAVQGLDVMKAILLTEAANSGTKGHS